MGGKEKLTPYIRQVLPPSPRTYLEACGGGGAILLGLTPSNKRLDIYNDANWDLANVFLCVRDQPLALLKEMGYLPIHSRAEFELLRAGLLREAFPEDVELEEEMRVARESFQPEQTAELLELLRGRAELRNVRRAAAFLKVSRGSFSGTMDSFGVKPQSLRSFYYLLWKASRRLENVVIENQDCAKIIRDRDGPETTVYCDPPYYKAEKCYDVLFGEPDHIRLHETLRKCAGSVVLSYNDCGFIRQLYEDFFILAFQRNNPLAQTGGARYGEMILTNYDPREIVPQMGMFDMVGDMDLVHVPDTILKKI